MCDLLGISVCTARLCSPRKPAVRRGTPQPSRFGDRPRSTYTIHIVSWTMHNAPASYSLTKETIQLYSIRTRHFSTHNFQPWVKPVLQKTVQLKSKMFRYQRVWSRGYKYEAQKPYQWSETWLNQSILKAVPKIIPSVTRDDNRMNAMGILQGIALAYKLLYVSIVL